MTDQPTDESPAQSIFEAAGGEDAFLALAEAWHHRVMEDAVVSHANQQAQRVVVHGQRLAAGAGASASKPISV